MKLSIAIPPIATLPFALIAITVTPIYAQTAPVGGVSDLGPVSGVTAPPQSGSTLKLALPRETAVVVTGWSRFVSGSSVPIAFTIANRTSTLVEHDFNNGQKYDFEVRDAKGLLLWQWSRGMSFTQAVDKLILKPGESKTFRGEWNGKIAGKPAAPGQYLLLARLTTQTRPGVRGGILVNPVRDPNNMGMPTRSPTENGMIVQTATRSAVVATTRFQIVAKK